MPETEKQSIEVKNLLESPGSREGACEWPWCHQDTKVAVWLFVTSREKGDTRRSPASDAHTAEGQ